MKPPLLVSVLATLQPSCLARYSSQSLPPKAKPPSLLGWEVWGEAPSLRLGFRGYTPVAEGIQEGSKRLRPRGSRFGRMSMVGSEPPVFSLRLSSSATAMPDPSRAANPQKQSRPSACAEGAKGGGALIRLGFWIYPCKGALGKNMRKDEIERSPLMAG